MEKKKEDKKDLGRPKRGGSDTMREKGHKGVLLSFSPEEHQLLKQAAQDAGDGTLAGFGRRVLLAEAARVRVATAKRTLEEEERKESGK